MSYPFTEIVIIYNPNSTGPSKQNALDLQKSLKGKLPKTVKVATKGTKDVGHAEDIGATYAKKDSKTLLVSSSGDGGYNELVNGVLSCNNKHVAVAVMPSGNANDHHHATATDDLVTRIVAGKTRKIDVIEVNTTKDGKPWKRYAHSYVGVGMTAYIGEKLTKADLNPWNEKWMVLKYMLKFSHVTLQLEGDKRPKRYSNVIFANIDRMSKVISLSSNAKIDDGKFEVYTSPAGSIWQIIRYLLKGATVGLQPVRITESLTYTASKPHKVQLDGEVFSVDESQVVEFRAKHNMLRMI